MIASVLSGSEALFADSAAMMVDSLTYLFNWYAERRKKEYAESMMMMMTMTTQQPLPEQDSHGYNDSDNNNNKNNNKNSINNNSSIDVGNRKMQLLLQKYTLQLEIVPPLVSVTTLLTVTGFTLNGAVSVLVLDSKRDESEQDEPNVHVMMIFSILNLFLDCLNVLCFASANHALGYRTTVASNSNNNNNAPSHSDESSSNEYGTIIAAAAATEAAAAATSADSNNNRGTHHGNDNDGPEEEEEEEEESATMESSMEPFEIEDRSEHREEEQRESGSNLNMCSAYTVCNVMCA